MQEALEHEEAHDPRGFFPHLDDTVVSMIGLLLSEGREGEEPTLFCR